MLVLQYLLQELLHFTTVIHLNFQDLEEKAVLPI